MNIELAQYLLPEDALDYFEIVSHNSSSENEIHFYFEEENLLPKLQHQRQNLTVSLQKTF